MVTLNTAGMELGIPPEPVAAGLSVARPASQHHQCWVAGAPWGGPISAPSACRYGDNLPARFLLLPMG